MIFSQKKHLRILLSETIRTYLSICKKSSNSDQVILIYGSKSSGKSHICEAIYNQYINSAFFINDKSILLDNIPTDFYELLIIDNLDKLISSKTDEEKIFTLVNNQILHKKPVLVSSSKDIKDCNITLEDLSSRLLSDKIFTIKDLDDSDKIEMMILYCSQRGLEISENVLHYIMNNCSRDLYFLCALIKNLDNVSLSMKKKITIPFIKKVIELHYN